MKFITKGLLTLLLLLPIALLAQTNATLMTYNILNFPDASSAGSDPVTGNAARAGYFRIVVEDAGADIIIVQELKTSAGADLLVNELNANGTLGKTYARVNNFTSYAGLGNMLIYNTGMFVLQSNTEVPRINTATSSNGTVVWAPRANSHYVLTHPVNPVCPAQEVELNVFSGHLKAGSDSATASEISDEARRNLGVLDLIDYINTNLNSVDNIIYGGDFNLQGTFESSYNSMTNAAMANLTDPLGGWVRNVSSDVAKYTQSTRASGSSSANGGATGGMDDRFDFIFYGDNVLSGSERIAYIANSYKNWGNENVNWNGGATSGTYIYDTEVELMSDHFPVKLDLFLDAPSSICGSNCPAIVNYGNPINSGVYNASVEITSNATIAAGQNVSFFAGTCVELQNGFEVQAGGVFCADIQTCFTGSETDDTQK